MRSNLPDCGTLTLSVSFSRRPPCCIRFPGTCWCGWSGMRFYLNDKLRFNRTNKKSLIEKKKENEK